MARRNVALSTNGGMASAQSALTNYAASGAINGNRTITDWGSNGGWSSSSGVLPQWLRVDFSGSMSIDEIDVITYGSSSAPTLTTAIDPTYGSTAFTIEYWDGVVWQLLTTVTGSTFVWRQFTYTPFTTTAIRVNVTYGANAGDTTARLVEVEAWGDDYTGISGTLTETIPLVGLTGVGSYQDNQSNTQIQPPGNITLPIRQFERIN